MFAVFYLTWHKYLHIKSSFNVVVTFL